MVWIVFAGAGATQRNDSVYSRKMTPMTSNYAMAPPMSSPMGPPMGPPSALPRTELETSNHSSAPLSPSDTSKDSAYGSVHGNVNQITVVRCPSSSLKFQLFFS